MPKFEMTIGEMMVYKIPVEAKTKDEAWDKAYEMFWKNKAKYEDYTMDVGFPDRIEEIE